MGEEVKNTDKGSNDTIHNVIVRCSNCKYMKYESPSHDQPYLEFWCNKGEWDGISSYSDLDKPIKCHKFNAAL